MLLRALAFMASVYGWFGTVQHASEDSSTQEGTTFELSETKTAAGWGRAVWTGQINTAQEKEAVYTNVELYGVFLYQCTSVPV